MLTFHLLCAFLSVAYGISVCIRKKMPLFYKILLYGFGCNLLGTLYLFCYQLTFASKPQGFTIELLGYFGMYFFLISSYVGAIDRLADGREKCYRSYRLFALLPSINLLAVFFIQIRRGLASSPSSLVLLPAIITVYYACKHLILPDVEMGIIRAMRPYNALLLIFCLLDAASVLPYAGLTAVSVTCEILADLVLMLMLPAAYKGVRQWFM